MAQSDTNPHIRQGNAPLQTLVTQSLRRFGEGDPSTIVGDVALMFIEFANMIIDEVRMHPYYDGWDLDYYTSLQDHRDVPDQVIIAGLLYHYSFQQMSEKVQLYMPAYFRSMSQALWERKHGNGPISMTVVDGGTNPRNREG